MQTFQVISPADGSVYLERKTASDSEIENTVKRSAEAQKKWSQTTLQERSAICRNTVQYFLDNHEEIGKEISWQMGRPIAFSPLEITSSFRERAFYMIEAAQEALAPIEIENSSHFHRFIRKVPLGIVFVLSPWNYPYLTSVNVVIPAIMAGNAVILKSAQQTPLCAERYAEAFRSAGLPDGVFQYLHLDHEQAAKIIGDNRIQFVAFTGSVSGGRSIHKAVSKRFINCSLELGGKDPAYVREDAKLPETVEQLVDGVYFNSGQSCCGIERIYVHTGIFQEFLEAFIDKVRQYKLGHPLHEETTLGPMVKTEAAEFVRTQVREAIEQGAKYHIEPSHFPQNKPDSPYLSPQVLTQVNHNMRIMKEETFGPVTGIMEVKDDEEAQRLMNDSPYGLTASIWTADIGKAEKLSGQLEAGTCFMNRCDYLDPALAWTGVKNSGKGCSLSVLGYDMLTRPKSFHLRKSWS